NRAKKSGMVNITSSVNSRERSGINTILHELNPLFTINVTMRDIKSKNVYSRVNSRSEERFSRNAETEIVCRLLLEKKKIDQQIKYSLYYLNNTPNTNINTLTLHDALPI